jgi:hypothetical protein
VATKAIKQRGDTMKMKKIAILVALGTAALMTAVTGASAGKGDKITDIQLDGNCDILTLTVFPWHQAGEYDTSCDGVDAVGSGMEGKVVGVTPKDLTIGETYFGNPNATFLFNIQYPLKTGNTWSIFTSTDGVNFSAFASGTYTVVGPDVKYHPRAGLPVHLAARK